MERCYGIFNIMELGYSCCQKKIKNQYGFKKKKIFWQLKYDGTIWEERDMNQILTHLSNLVGDGKKRRKTSLLT